MARLIDADARVTVQSFDVELEEYNYTEMSVAEALDFATDEGCPPAVDAAPVVHGRWITNDDCGELECPICGGIQIEHGMFCTWCGARMDGGDNHA